MGFLVVGSPDGADVTGPVWIPTAAPSWETYLAPTLQPLPILPALAAVLALLYLYGAGRLWRSGRTWPALPTLSFLTGCSVLAIVTGAGVEGYGFTLLSVFMFQQLTLMMAVPPLLVLGRPGLLLLRATPHSRLGGTVLVNARRALRSRAARVVVHPAVSIPLFLLAFYGLYLTDLADVLLRTWAGHTTLEVAFLLAGVLFTVPVLSQDPLPTRQSEPARALDLVLEMPLHAFFGVIMMMATTPMVTFFSTPPVTWNIDPMQDQGLAGGLAWAYGEAPGLLILLVIMTRWHRADSAHARARDRVVDRDGDSELDAYNAHLEDLARRSDTHGDRRPGPSRRHHLP